MSSATKLVIAGVVVALFGGSPVAGLSIHQPSDDRVPAIGGSASAATHDEPTGARTTEPEPTTEAAAEDSSADPHLLPGVDLVTEEVEPGVYRVLGDGRHDLRTDVWDVEVTPDGAVWVEKHRVTYEHRTKPCGDICRPPVFHADRVIRLGQKGAAFVPRRDAERRRDRDGNGLSIGVRDGRPIVNGLSRDYGWDGRRWQADPPGAVGTCGEVQAQGACWWSARVSGMTVGYSDVVHFVDRQTRASLEQADGDSHVVRVAEDGTAQIFTRDELGLDPDMRFGRHLAADPDGIVYTDVWRGVAHEGDEDATDESRFVGLAAYDGSEWTLIETDHPVVRHGGVVQLEAAPDGSIWMAFPLGSDPRAGAADFSSMVVSWDGEDWATYGPIVPVPVEESQWRLVSFVFGPDGRVWLDAVTYVEGSGLRRFEVPASVTDREPMVRSRSLAPDGSIWMVVIDPRTPRKLGCEPSGEGCQGVTDGLYVIIPEAMAAAE